MPAELKLTSAGGETTTFDLGDLVISITTKYNYSAPGWSIDIVDSVGVPLLSGIMLVPGVDLLAPYPQVKKTLGALVLFSKTEQGYQQVENLGKTAKLVWFSPGETVVYAA